MKADTSLPAKEPPSLLRRKIQLVDGLEYLADLISPRVFVAAPDFRPPQEESYLAQAFYAKEMGLEAVPIDQMEYSYDEAVPTLWLPPGELHIRIVDEKANVIYEYVARDR